MKRIAALLLAALVLCVGAAQAEWQEGTSAARPYTDQPEIDLNEQIGYMMFFPKAGNAIDYACQRLYIYLPRDDVKAGAGTFYVMTEKGDEVWSTEMTNAEAITQRSINDAELEGLQWGGGTCFEIRLPKTLELGKTYYVNMTRGCIVAENGVENVQIGGTDSWAITVEGDFGVSGMEYRRAQFGGYEEQLLKPQAGDEIRFDLELGGDAVLAAIYRHNDSVEFEQTIFTESGEVTGEVVSEDLSWGLMFLDADGHELGRVEFQ